MGKMLNVRGRGFVQKDGRRYELNWVAEATREALEQYAQTGACPAIELAEWRVGERPFAGTLLYFHVRDAGETVTKTGQPEVEHPTKGFVPLGEFLKLDV